MPGHAVDAEAPASASASASAPAPAPAPASAINAWLAFELAQDDREWCFSSFNVINWLSLQAPSPSSDWLAHLLSVSRKEGIIFKCSGRYQFPLPPDLLGSGFCDGPDGHPGLLLLLLLGVLGHEHGHGHGMAWHGMAFRNVRCEIATPPSTVMLSVKGSCVIDQNQKQRLSLSRARREDREG